MQWIVFSYSLPSKGSSSPRVTLWRRLRRLGAVSPAGGAHILPLRDDCLEAFQWLAQEIRQAQGEAVVLHVSRIDGLTDQQIIRLFQTGRSEEYAELDAEATALEQTARESADSADHDRLGDELEKLRRHYAEIARVDYFDCPEGARVAARLAAIERIIAPVPADRPLVAPALLAAYHDARWLTRPRPHVDRLACAWLIRRYINPAAPIRYSIQPEPGEITFDMPDADFGHRGQLCTFETMIQAFGIDEAALTTLAEIVHEIDLRDGQYKRPEIAGIDGVLRGWLLLELTDAEREARGHALFDGLFTAIASDSNRREQLSDSRSAYLPPDSAP